MNRLLQKHARNLTGRQENRLSDYLSRQPAIAGIYRFKEELIALLTAKNRTKAQCRLLIYRMLEAITELKQSGFEECRKVGRTLENWQGGDRADVAVLTIERHHRRLPPKDEADPAPCLRLPQFRKLPSTRAGTMRLTKNTMKDEEEV